MGWLTRMVGPVTLAAAAAAPAPRPRPASLTAPDGIASLDSVQLGPFLVPDREQWGGTRGTAWRVPAAAQGLQVIAGTIATLPLRRWRGAVALEDTTLVGQPDPWCPGSATMQATVEDLVLYPYAYWIVTSRDARGFPATARHVPADLVDDRLERDGTVRYLGVIYPVTDVLRFHSPTPGLLATGRDALWTAYLLECAVQRYAREPQPAGYIRNTGPVDLDDDDVDDLLTDWVAARNARATAYLGPNTAYEPTAFNPEQLQLIAGREEAAAELARLLNLPPHYLNAPAAGGASMTYTTLETARRDLVDLCLSQYMTAVDSRLSLDDVVPHGQTVRYDLTGFYRSDFTGLVTSGVAAVGAGLITIPEWRTLAGLPAAPDGTDPGGPPPAPGG